MLGNTERRRIVLPITYVVNVPVTDVWDSPESRGEHNRLTQALLGDPVLAEEKNNFWLKVQVPDGYRGYVQRAHLVPASAPCSSLKGTVITAQTQIQLVEEEAPYHRQITAYLGTKLQLAQGTGPGTRDYHYTVYLPDGKTGLIGQDSVAVGKPSRHLAQVAERAQRLALCFIEAPYLWGGITCAGVDCSGLVYATYRCAGLLLPRDADQQYLSSQPVAGPPVPGDLVFFATEEPDVASHVGLYLGQERFLHASSRLGGVVITSLNSPFYRRHLLGWHRCRANCRRLGSAAGFESAEGEVSRREQEARSDWIEVPPVGS